MDYLLSGDTDAIVKIGMVSILTREMHE